MSIPTEFPNILLWTSKDTSVCSLKEFDVPWVDLLDDAPV